MNHLEVIRLSRQIDSNGSIMLSSRYTQFLDLYLADLNSDDTKGYLYNGREVTPASHNWASFGTLLIVKKQGCYHLIVGFFGGSWLIEAFLTTVFEYGFSCNQTTRFLWALTMTKDDNNNTGATWVQKPCVDKLYYTAPLARVSQAIVDRFMQNKKYSIMVFNANSTEKQSLPFYIQLALMSYYNRAGYIWLNINLTRGNFNLTDEVLSGVSMNLPSIATYTNILESYQDALTADRTTLKGFERYSKNKQTLTSAFDKMGDTEGAISIVFCDCADSRALDKLTKMSNTNGVEIESFYRKGRIDGELTFIVQNSIVRTDMSQFSADNQVQNIMLFDKATGDEFYFKP